MPPFSPKPSPIPRPQNLFIYSLFTLQKSLKNYRKHFKCLKIETKTSSYKNIQMLSQSLLTILQTRSKSVPVLDLKRHEQFFNLKAPQSLTLIKSFNHLNSLYLLGNVSKYFSTKSCPKWLTQSKNLKHLTFGKHVIYDISRMKSLSYSMALQAKYHKSLKRSKLLSLDLQASQASIFESEVFPARLKKLSMYLTGPMAKNYPLDLSHLHHISILHLNITLFFPNLLKILNSLPNPQTITHLTIHACDSNEGSAEKLSKALAPFHSLCSLTLEIDSFSLPSFLKNNISLCELRLSLAFQHQNELIDLALFIGSLKNLSQLAVVNLKLNYGYTDKAYQISFQEISGLVQLKSLEINLGSRIDSSQRSELFHKGCMREFANCLKILRELQEIKFTASEGGLAPEFDLLAEAFEKKGVSLKKLKLKFVDAETKIDHLKKLNKAFQAMANLEELSLENFWTEKQSLFQLIEVLSQLKWLKSVHIDGENPPLEEIDFVRTLKKILMKYGLEELKWFGEVLIVQMDYLGYFRENVSLVDIKEIILKNPRLHSVSLDSHGLYFKNMEDFLPGNEFKVI